MEILLGILVVSILVYLGYKEWLLSKQQSITDVLAEMEKRQEAERKHFWKEAQKERQELYDRLMSRDLTDFKVATDELSETFVPDTEDEDYTFPLTGAQTLTEEERVEIETGKPPPKTRKKK